MVDATPFGIRDCIREIWEGLSIYFPGIPILILSALGDLQTDKVLERLPIHRWVHRLHDQHKWFHRNEAGTEPELPWEPTLIEIPDVTLDTLLSETYGKVHNLRNLVSGESRSVQQNTYGKAAKVQQTLATLCCPLQARERLLGRHSRRGLFAIRTIERELEILEKAQVRYGDIENIRRDVHESLCSLYQLIDSGTTGKTQALEELVRAGVRERKSTLILVANRAEEEAVIDFLHGQDIALVDNKLLSVKPSGQIKSALSLTDPYDRCLIFSRVWDKDMWWLAGVSRQLFLLCYPFEVAWARKRLTFWESKYARPSAESGDKANLLRFAWPKKGFIHDAYTLEIESRLQFRRMDTCAGNYPRNKTFSIIRECNSLKWITEILDAEEQIKEEEIAKGSESPRDCVRITLQDTLVDIFWPLSSSIHVLSDNGDDTGVEIKRASELSAGEQIIMLRDGGGYSEILQCLFETFNSSPEAGELSRWASHWEALVDSATENYDSPRKLQAKLQQLGTSVTLQTVNNWLNKKVSGPEDQQSVKNLALAVGNKTLAHYAPSIHKAITGIWTEHRQIGKDLHQALLARAAGATKVQIGSMNIDTDALDEILEIHTVHAVELPGDEPIFPKCLADLAPRIQEKFADRLLLTRRAISSMEDSPYRDLDKAWACFEIVASDLWRLFIGELRKGEVMAAFQQIGVELKSGTSQITQGKCTGYKVRYEGNTVDIGAHLCLGAIRDPAKTLRIHYHWDSQKSLVVIHHAGKHLPTRFS